MPKFTLTNATAQVATDPQTGEQTLTITAPQVYIIRELDVRAVYYVNITRDSLSRYILRSVSKGNIGVSRTTY